MDRKKTDNPQGGLPQDPGGTASQFAAPWYFEATLKQELNRMRSRRDRLRKVRRGAIRFGIPGVCVVVLAIVALAGLRRSELPPSAGEELPPSVAADTLASGEDRGSEAVQPVARKKKKVSAPPIEAALDISHAPDRSVPSTDHGMREAGSSSLKEASTISTADSSVVEPERLETDTTAAIQSDSTAANPDSALALRDSSEVREQPPSSLSPER
ncbi:MAG: hypothetical protein KAJ12_05350 [Bacteroidetes bacterium]|nr:hypothetical protein [Bacteroidota bacterium]